MARLEVRNTKVHSCDKQVARLHPATFDSKNLKCRCRQLVTLAEAKELIDRGEAYPAVLGWDLVDRKESCTICTEDDRKSCKICNGSGVISITLQEPRHAPIEISELVYASPNIDARKRKVFRSGISKRTPRVATVEKAHIERAYVKGDKDECERIELFKLTEFFARAFLGQLNKHISAIGAEPADDSKNRIGRNYDYGFAPFSTIRDERTPGGVGIEEFLDEDEDELSSLTIIDSPNQSLIVDEGANEPS